MSVLGFSGERRRATPFDFHEHIRPELHGKLSPEKLDRLGDILHGGLKGVRPVRHDMKEHELDKLMKAIKEDPESRNDFSRKEREHIDTALRGYLGKKEKVSEEVE